MEVGAAESTLNELAKLHVHSIKTQVGLADWFDRRKGMECIISPIGSQSIVLPL